MMRVQRGRGPWLVLAGMLLLGEPLASQEPMARREQLQQMVMQRFMRNVQLHAGLSDEQVERFQDVTRQAFEARARLEERERALWMALEGQMRPGIAANRDSVTLLLDGLVALQAQRAEQLRQEQTAYQEFLNPVQRAQVTMAWRRLQEEIQRIQRQRMEPAPRRRP